MSLQGILFYVASICVALFAMLQRTETASEPWDICALSCNAAMRGPDLLNDCDSFFICANGVAHYLPCGEDLKFDDAKKTCVNATTLNNCTFLQEPDEEGCYTDPEDYSNWGFNNTGSYNIGNDNGGTANIGNSNTGDYNIGNKNIGISNVGNSNEGLNNIGNGNVGVNNVGNDNYGEYNYGNENFGIANIGDRNGGIGNVGVGNNGIVNVGEYNLGLANIGKDNDGIGNIGTNNTGLFNIGNNNYGYGYIGDDIIGNFSFPPEEYYNDTFGNYTYMYYEDFIQDLTSDITLETEVLEQRSNSTSNP